MGSCGEVNMTAIDASVGGLVWVRRRNGSWWPGRILGANELPESCSASPRSGTPVKLLGREDASVDWYNLEKSKRVKAFRCGEYDECILKAKASAANSSKKVVKYARREDAILHALELESARQSKDNPDICSRMNKPSGEEGGSEDSPDTLLLDEEIYHMAERQSSFEDNSNSGHELSHSGVSFEEPNQISASKEQSVQGTQRRTLNDSGDDGMEEIKRMRGLGDLGMSVMSSLKRKRSEVAKVHEFLRRKNRRRQLTKVLESTSMVTVPVMCEQPPSPTGSSILGLSDTKVSGLESNESKRSFSMVLNNNSDSTGVSSENGTSLNASEHASDAFFINVKQKENEISSMLGLPETNYSEKLFDVPLVEEDKHPAGFSSIFVSCASQKPQIGAGAQSSQSNQVETVAFGNEEFNQSGSTSSGAATINITSNGIEKGTSKWQSKGKRNFRHKSKNKKCELRKFMDVDGKSNEYFESLEPDNVSPLGPYQKVNDSPFDGSLSSDSFPSQEKSRAVMETQVDDFRGWSRHTCMKEPATALVTPQRSLPYRQSRFTVNRKYQSSDSPLRVYGADSCLYDVSVEVKVSYRPQHVPYVSLMSKLNGQPIIGHPLTVEALDEGFCGVLLGDSEMYSSSCELDDDFEEDTYAVQGVDTGYHLKPNPGSGSIRSKHHALQLHISPSKSPKSRKNGPLSKKIRKLSSLTGSRKQSVEVKQPVVEKLKGPAIACVPLQVVFSRINSALNCSILPARHVMTTSNS